MFWCICSCRLLVNSFLICYIFDSNELINDRSLTSLLQISSYPLQNFKSNAIILITTCNLLHLITFWFITDVLNWKIKHFDIDSIATSGKSYRKTSFVISSEKCCLISSTDMRSCCMTSRPSASTWSAGRKYGRLRSPGAMHWFDWQTRGSANSNKERHRTGTLQLCFFKLKGQSRDSISGSHLLRDFED